MYWTLRITSIFIAPLPFRIGYAIAVVLGFCGYYLRRRSTPLVKQNIRRVLGPDIDERTVKRIARRCCINLSLNYYDIVRVPRLSHDDLDRMIEFHGLEHLEPASASGRGVVVATAHLGNYDLVPQATLARAIPITILVERMRDERLWQFLMQMRRAGGLAFLPVDMSGIRAAFRTLKGGGLVGIASDRLVKGDAIVAPFMGEAAPMPAGAAQLAVRTGAAILPTFCLRRGPNRYRIHVEPPIFPCAGAPREEEVARLTQQMITVMERYIRANPDQWMIFQPLWTLGDGTRLPVGTHVDPPSED